MGDVENIEPVPCNAICHLVGKVQHEEKKENRENVANKNEKKVISPQKCKKMRAKNLAVK